MTGATRKPRLFIGSSVESLEIAYAIQESLDHDAECTVWTQGVFRPTRQALDSLIQTLDTVDCAVFAFTPDDIAIIRGEQHRIVRDNIIFELGLFMGRLGAAGCFLVAPRSSPALHLPSDLLGLTVLTYNDQRSDKNNFAALGAACNAIRRELPAVARLRREASLDALPVETVQDKYLRLEALWNGDELKRDRAILRAGIPLSALEDEDGVATAALERVYSFLNAVADTLLKDPGLALRARPVFAQAVRSVWERVFAYFTPPSADSSEVWGSDLPPVAKLNLLWAQ
ncbi:hypothetical protein GHT07_09415 [Caenimonas koreensis DSM 17982]|uniref:CD-NTase-associated protein 12/Pycsar effector protein TIR domain-containing protein n=1 Tax=Caenimonas koreensis DSM 17982 TaxID=1121255 RepID=A0A844AT32_9BURK|nr:nucleotide-binding protein [Caenimonas koreensis]MRD47495.1 hypothetical protein [Caenimonas koreensis DSM 17982]